jgi:hypothetical protein
MLYADNHGDLTVVAEMPSEHINDTLRMLRDSGLTPVCLSEDWRARGRHVLLIPIAVPHDQAEDAATILRAAELDSEERVEKIEMEVTGQLLLLAIPLGGLVATAVGLCIIDEQVARLAGWTMLLPFAVAYLLWKWFRPRKQHSDEADQA